MLKLKHAKFYQVTIIEIEVLSQKEDKGKKKAQFQGGTEQMSVMS